MNAREMILAGHQARREKRATEAKALFVQAFEGADSPDDRVDALRGWANAESDLGAFAEAAARYAEAVALLRGLDEPLKLAHTVRHLGDVLRRAGLMGEALPCYDEALGIYRDHPEAESLDLGNALRGYGLLLEAMGDNLRARQVWVEVLGIYREVGVQAGVDEAQRRMAALLET